MYRWVSIVIPMLVALWGLPAQSFEQIPAQERHCLGNCYMIHTPFPTREQAGLFAMSKRPSHAYRYIVWDTGFDYFNHATVGVIQLLVDRQNSQGQWVREWIDEGNYNHTWLCPEGYNLLNAGQTGGMPYCVASGQVKYLPPKMPLSCDESPISGNPVFVLTGNKTETETDYSGSGSSDGLHLIRYYNARIAMMPGAPHGSGFDSLPYTTLYGAPAYSFGYGYSHDYSARLTIVTGNGERFVEAYRPTGASHLFRIASGNVESDTGMRDRLNELTDGNGNTTGWRYLAMDGNRIESYGADGQLQSITFANGVTHTLAYSDGTAGDGSGYILDANGNPTSGILLSGMLLKVTDSFGNKLSFGYDSQFRIIRVTVPDGGVISYTYGAVHNLETVTYPDGNVRHYHHEDSYYPFLLTGLTDERGIRYATWSYDGLARVTASVHAGGVDNTTFSYTANSTTVTDPLGSSHTFGFQSINGNRKLSSQSQPAGAGCAAASATMTYDANGNATSRTDFSGNKNCHAHDLTRNLEIKRVEGLSSSADCAAALANPPAPTTANPVRVISRIWHPDWGLEVRRAEPNKITTWVYNGQPDPTAGGTPAACAPADAQLPDGKPIVVLCKKIEQATTDVSGSQGMAATITGAARIWTRTFNRYGQPLTEDGPRTDVSDVTTYAYYDVTDADTGKRGNLASIANALGQLFQITGYDVHGRPTTLVDSNGITTTFAYDLRGRLTTKNVAGEVTVYAYDPAGQISQVSQPDGSIWSYTYDSAHRLIAIADGIGNRIQYTLDAMGNRIKEDILDSGGTLVQTRSRTYDPLGRLYQDIGAQNQVTAYAYDANGNLTGITDPLNRVTLRVVDSLNRPIRITDPANGQTGFVYDGQNQLVQVVDPRNLVTGYTIDGLGNRAGQFSPDTGTTAQSFDTAGNLTIRTDAKNQTTQYHYDALNRLTQITLADGSRHVHAWDSGSNGIGRLARITEFNSASQETGRTEYGYDAQGRVVLETRTIGGLPYVNLYGYSNGRLASLTYPSGRLVEYGYDNIGRVNQVSTTPTGGSSQVVVSQVTYHPFGGVKSFTYGNGQTHTRNIDQDGRITGYTLAGQTQAIGYDVAARIVSIGDLANPAIAVTYGYDSLDRLTSAILPNTSYGYAYDATGNRTSRTIGADSMPYSISPTSNQLLSIGDTPPRSFSYDGNGSVTNDGNNQYGYDVRGRLSQVVTAQGTTSHEVNALGERVRKSGTGSPRLYHYDRQGRLIAEGGATGLIDREYLYLHDLPVAVVVP